MPTEQTDTIVGVNVELKGSLHNRGPIHIHGKVTGDIYSDSLIVIGETAIVNGPIVGKQIDVSGQVNGSINAEDQLELQPKCLVRGDITTNRLSIKPGAIFIGKSQMNMLDELPVQSEIPLPEEEKKRPHLEID